MTGFFYNSLIDFSVNWTIYPVLANTITEFQPVQDILNGVNFNLIRGLVHIDNMAGLPASYFSLDSSSWVLSDTRYVRLTESYYMTVDGISTLYSNYFAEAKTRFTNAYVSSLISNTDIHSASLQVGQYIVQYVHATEHRFDSHIPFMLNILNTGGNHNFVLVDKIIYGATGTICIFYNDLTQQYIFVITSLTPLRTISMLEHFQQYVIDNDYAEMKGVLIMGGRKFATFYYYKNIYYQGLELCNHAPFMKDLIPLSINDNFSKLVFSALHNDGLPRFPVLGVWPREADLYKCIIAQNILLLRDNNLESVEDCSMTATDIAYYFFFTLTLLRASEYSAFMTYSFLLEKPCSVQGEVQQTSHSIIKLLIRFIRIYLDN